MLPWWFSFCISFGFGLISSFFVIKWKHIFIFTYSLRKIYVTQVPKYQEHLHESGNFRALIGNMVNHQVSTSDGTFRKKY